MHVVDTNIVVNLLMERPYSDPARALHARDPDWQSEPLLLIELTNVLATVVRKLAYRLDDATAILNNAQRIIAPGLRRVADHDVLNAAAHYGVTGYDARFLVVARAESSIDLINPGRLTQVGSRQHQQTRPHP